MTFAGAIASDSTQTCSHSSVHGAAQPAGISLHRNVVEMAGAEIAAAV